MDDLFRKALEKLPVDTDYSDDLGCLYRAYAQEDPFLLTTTSFNFGYLVGLKLARFEKDLPAADTKGPFEE